MRKIQKGDTVKITTGKDKGKTGVIESVKNNKVIIAGQNIYKKNIKSTSEKAGGIVDKAMPIDISNVMLITGKDEVTRVSFKVEKDKKFRVSTKTGEKI